jgi:hypothetical protein
MKHELIIFIASILLGALFFWRENKGNGVYRFINKLMNSKELQMKSTDKKGFVYQQSFLFRLVFLTFLFLTGILVFQFLIPNNFATILLFAALVLGTLVGTYVAEFVFTSTKIIKKQTQEIIEKGKDLIEDLQAKDLKEIENEELSKKESKVKE